MQVVIFPFHATILSYNLLAMNWIADIKVTVTHRAGHPYSLNPKLFGTTFMMNVCNYFGDTFIVLCDRQ